MATTIHTRLRRVMRSMQWSQAELAKAAGASRPTVSRWLSDGRIKIDAAFAFSLQDKTGFSARWILLGQGPASVLEVAKQIIRDNEFRGQNSREK